MINIPKKMTNEESKHWAQIVTSSRLIEVHKGLIQIAKNKLGDTLTRTA